MAKNPGLGARLMKEWRTKNPERAREIAKTYRDRNADAIRARKAAYYAKTQEQRCEASREWYALNKERGKSNARNWKKTNPEKARMVSRIAAEKRRAKLLASAGSGIDAKQWAELVEQFGGRCAYCLTNDGDTIDHVVPISRDGAHDIDNAVPACLSCNASKRDKSLLRFVACGGGLV